MATPKELFFKLDEFWERVSIDPSDDGCWFWTGSTKKGRGYVQRKGNLYQVHRFAWMLYFGPIPPTQNVCHTCDVGLCIRPNHLFLGTQADNIHDMWRKGRASKPPTHVGTNNSRSKLDDDKVRNMRALFEYGASYAELGRLFSTTAENVSSVVNRKTWRHVCP